MSKKSYHELMSFQTFEDRLKYLFLNGIPGEITFGGHRNLNQLLYTSYEWKETRNKIIIRDDGLDLACEDYPIYGSIYIHHINPLTIDDVLYKRPCVMDPENLICVSFRTHNLIHYGPPKVIEEEFKMFQERRPNDTCPWMV